MHASLLSLLPLLSLLCIRALAADVSVVTVPATLPTNAPSYVDDSSFKSAILNSTNFFRKEHNATALKWNTSLTDFASNHDENCGGPDGENLAEGYANVTSAVDAWGNERSKYNFKSGSFSEATGHFTQLVWKASSTVGCGRKWCDGDFTGWYLVCEYWPRGNVIGEFVENVQSQVTDEGGNDTGSDAGGGSGAPDCPQGAKCSAASSVRVKDLWIAVIVVAVMGLA
ncbi:MAG: hypothetical protein MMC23_002240 [Stictis urceolatum]|nr:hypothetical protein [Stictis urceolata]